MKSIFQLMLAVFLGGIMANAVGADPMITTGVTYAVLQTQNLVRLPQGVLFTSVDVSALTPYAGQNEKSLLWTMVNSMSAAMDLIVRPNIKNKLRIGKLNVSNGTRPFSSTEEFGTGDLAYTDRFLDVSAGKREMLIDVEQYSQEYLSEFLMAGSAANKSKTEQIPFAAWTFDKIMKAVGAEINNKTTWSGFDKNDAVPFDAGDAYAVGDYVTFTVSGRTEWFKCLTITVAGESPATTPAKWQNVTAEAITKGIGTILAEEIAGGGLTVTTTSAISSGALAISEMKKMFRAMPIAYRDGGVIINCSFTDFDFLVDGIDDIAKYAEYDRTATEARINIKYLYLPGSMRKCIVKPATWNTSRRLVAGPLAMVNGEARNAALLLGTDLLSDFNGVSLKESNLWDLKVGLKFRLGFQVANLEEIKVSSQV